MCILKFENARVCPRERGQIKETATARRGDGPGVRVLSAKKEEEDGRCTMGVPYIHTHTHVRPPCTRPAAKVLLN